ncbi:hypothetical protein Tco_0474279 [Tanacetum coccineum]
MPSPSVSTFTFPSTSEPVFSVSTSEPVFETPNHSQTSQTTQSQQLQQYHTTTVSNNNAKFPYLKKEKYETWAMKMEYWIMNSDHNLWNIVLNGNNKKKTGRDPKGNIMILPLDHMADFHHLDDARDIWLAVKARFGGNDESKKMRKSMLKQEFSEFRVSKSEGLHKGYDRFKKILSQLNQMQAKPDNEDCNMKFLRALPPSCPAASSNVIENVLHSFVAESDPQQQITYEDFDQIRKLDLEELDIKWQMAMLSVRINRFEKKAGRKMKFNNKDAARECKGTVGFLSKVHISSFKLKELDKSEEPKALLSVDSMLNWSDHEGEDVENGAAQVYGMIAGAEEDAAGSATGDATGDVADDVSNAAAEFALMGISSQVQAYKSTLHTLEQQKGWYQSNQLALEERIRILTANLENTTNMLKYTEKLNEHAKLEKLNDKVKLEESKARFDKWKDSSKNLDKMIHSSMSSRSKFGLGFGETFGSDEVFDPSAPSIFDTTHEDVAEKPLYDRFVKAVGMHAVPPPITGTFMPPSNNPDLDDNSDKSSDSETTGFVASVFQVSSPQALRPMNLALPLFSAFQTMSERRMLDQQQVPPMMILVFLLRRMPASVPAGSRNRPASVPAGSRNRPTSVPAGRPFSAGWKNHAARPMTRPTSHYFQHFSRPGYYNQMNMDEGRWGTADNPHKNRDLGIVDSGCSRSMTGNKEKLDDFVKIVGGTMTFGGGDGKITGKGTIRTSKLNFENVYYVEELQNFNLFSVSQICDTKNKVLFTDKECLVLSKEFQLLEIVWWFSGVPRRKQSLCLICRHKT